MLLGHHRGENGSRPVHEHAIEDKEASVKAHRALVGKPQGLPQYEPFPDKPDGNPHTGIEGKGNRLKARYDPRFPLAWVPSHLRWRPLAPVPDEGIGKKQPARNKKQEALTPSHRVS